MKNKKAFAVVLGLVLAIVGYLAWPPRPGVTRANFQRLHASMTKEEIDDRLGMVGKLLLSNPDTDVFAWVDGENVVMIHFRGNLAITGAFRDSSDKLENLRAEPGR